MLVATFLDCFDSEINIDCPLWDKHRIFNDSLGFAPIWTFAVKDPSDFLTSSFFYDASNISDFAVFETKDYVRVNVIKAKQMFIRVFKAKELDYRRTMRKFDINDIIDNHCEERYAAYLVNQNKVLTTNYLTVYETVNRDITDKGHDIKYSLNYGSPYVTEAIVNPIYSNVGDTPLRGHLDMTSVSQYMFGRQYLTDIAALIGDMGLFFDDGIEGFKRGKASDMDPMQKTEYVDIITRSFFNTIMGPLVVNSNRFTKQEDSVSVDEGELKDLLRSMIKGALAFPRICNIYEDFYTKYGLFSLAVRGARDDIAHFDEAVYDSYCDRLKSIMTASDDSYVKELTDPKNKEKLDHLLKTGWFKEMFKDEPEWAGRADLFK